MGVGPRHVCVGFELRLMRVGRAYFCVSCSVTCIILAMKIELALDRGNSCSCVSFSCWSRGDPGTPRVKGTRRIGGYGEM